MPMSPREVAEQVRKMVAGEGVVFADLFAADGVLAYPFAPPGQPPELRGRDAIRAYFAGLGQSRELFTMAGIDAVTWQTDDPEVAVTQITHHGWSNVTGALPVHRARRHPGTRRPDRPLRGLHGPDRPGPAPRPHRRPRRRAHRALSGPGAGYLGRRAARCRRAGRRRPRP